MHSPSSSVALGRCTPRGKAIDHAAGYDFTATAITVPISGYRARPGNGRVRLARISLHRMKSTSQRRESDTVLNGRKLQESQTSRLIFDIPELIATVSTFTTLLPRDVILTGTPGGVGYRRPRRSFFRGQ